MKSYNIAVIPGDGIGPEVTKEAKRILDKLSPVLSSKFNWVEHDLGAGQYLKTKEAMPESVWKELQSSDAIFLGAVGDPRVAPGILEREILLKIRFDLDLYINLRPCFLYDGVYTPLKHKVAKDIHFVVVRENTESVYTGVGGIFKKGTPDEVAIQEDVNTRKGVERCICFAYDYCKNYGSKKRLTLVDKANVLTHAHSLWRRVFEAVGSEYKEIERNGLYIDAACMDFVRRPEFFDVLVTNNIFGDILTDLGAIISGGLGFAASSNVNASGKIGGGRCAALFEPVHGSAPDIAGKGLANPVAAILALKMLLEYFGEAAAGKKIESAVGNAVKSGKLFKPESTDLAVSTSQVGEAILNLI